LNGALQTELEGAWVPVAVNVSGQPLGVEDLRVARLVFDHGGYRILDHSTSVVDSGEYVVDESAQPPSMDIVGREGPYAGRTMFAVIELSDDRLTVSYDLEGKTRPACPNAEAAEDQHILTIVYARASSVLS
jgi:uncharacterized protein (TIGR03067 family)